MEITLVNELVFRALDVPVFRLLAICATIHDTCCSSMPRPLMMHYFVKETRLMTTLALCLNI